MYFLFLLLFFSAVVSVAVLEVVLAVEWVQRSRARVGLRRRRRSLKRVLLRYETG